MQPGPGDSNVVELDDYRPHVVGIAECPECGYERAGIIMEKSRDLGLECAKCGAMKGRFK